MIEPLKHKYLLKFALYSCLIIASRNSPGQTLTVQSGVVSIADGTVNLNETSLANHGTLVTEENTNVIFSGNSAVTLSGSSPLVIHSLRIDTDCLLNTDLTIRDSIILLSGSLDLVNNTLNLDGSIFRENNDNNIFSTGSGEIVKITNLIANQETNPGNMGLGLKPLADYFQFELRRGHQVSDNYSSSSIKRYYTLEPISEDFNLTFRYLDSELNDISEKTLSLWGEINNSWAPIITYESDTASNQLLALVSEAFDRLSLFPGELEDVIIPKGFSPNGDGINDYLLIEGIEKFPDNKLIVFNQWGDVLFEASPYMNDWNGESEFRLASQQDKKLFDGTYFYVFYKKVDNKNSVKKGFFELKSNTD